MGVKGGGRKGPSGKHHSTPAGCEHMGRNVLLFPHTLSLEAANSRSFLLMIENLIRKESYFSNLANM